MRTGPAWQYDEFKQIGTDYDSIAEVEAYDRSMSWRDVAGETEHILDVLEITPESTILEIGCGTGEFAIRAAARCARVYAADISEPMLEFARHKAESRGVHNVEFLRAGFLTFELDEPMDAVVSQIALHHLPDYWKAVALVRVHDALRDGGMFFLRDVVFPGDVRQHDDIFGRWITKAQEKTGGKVRCEIETQIREEHSTLDWIMEGLLERTGFSVTMDGSKSLFATYVCTKNG